MTGAEAMGITLGDLMAFVLFFLTVGGAGWGIWWKIEGRLAALKAEVSSAISSSQAKADLALLKIHEHELHSSQIYATKQGMQEQTSQLLRAIEGVGNRIDGLHERLDRAFERPATRRAG